MMQATLRVLLATLLLAGAGCVELPAFLFEGAGSEPPILSPAPGEWWRVEPGATGFGSQVGFRWVVPEGAVGSWHGPDGKEHPAVWWEVAPLLDAADVDALGSWWIVMFVPSDDGSYAFGAIAGEWTGGVRDANRVIDVLPMLEPRVLRWSHDRLRPGIELGFVVAAKTALVPEPGAPLPIHFHAHPIDFGLAVRTMDPAEVARGGAASRPSTPEAAARVEAPVHPGGDVELMVVAACLMEGLDRDVRTHETKIVRPLLSGLRTEVGTTRLEVPRHRADWSYAEIAFSGTGVTMPWEATVEGTGAPASASGSDAGSAACDAGHVEVRPRVVTVGEDLQDGPADARAVLEFHQLAPGLPRGWMGIHVGMDAPERLLGVVPQVVRAVELNERAYVVAEGGVMEYVVPGIRSVVWLNAQP